MTNEEFPGPIPEPSKEFEEERMKLEIELTSQFVDQDPELSKLKNTLASLTVRLASFERMLTNLEGKKAEAIGTPQEKEIEEAIARLRQEAEEAQLERNLTQKIFFQTLIQSEELKERILINLKNLQSRYSGDN